MLKEIANRYGEQVLHEAARRYGATCEQISALGGFESYVYEYRRDDRSLVIKITHQMRRTVENLTGEVEWLDFLDRHGVPVCRCVSSLSGRFVEKIPDNRGQDFLALAYQKAQGHRPNGSGWDEHLFERWGEVVGQIHAVTKYFHFSHPRYKRQEWYEEEQLNARVNLPVEEGAVIEFIEPTVEGLKKLPRTVESYGLVHSDLHQGNFFVNDGALQVFDFDDIGYNYFIDDIAIVLYYALNYPLKEPGNIVRYAEDFWRSFMKGYSKYNQLEGAWFQYLPQFMNLRHALQFVVFHQANDITKLDDHGLQLLEQHREEVLKGMEVARVVKKIVERF